MALAAPSLSSLCAPGRATVRVFNETTWPIAVAARGGRPPNQVIAPGGEATLSLPGAEPALAVSGQGQRRLYALDFDLLGFDTVHVRAADLMPIPAR